MSAKSQAFSLIRDAYTALTDTGNAMQIGTLFDMCEDEEKRHRRAAPYGTRWSITVKDAARLFVVRTIAQSLEKPDRWTVADVLSIKASAIYAQALVLNHGPQIDAAWTGIDRSAVLALDYAKLVRP